MSNWSTVKLGEVCDVRDGTHDSPKYYDSGYPLVTSKNVTHGKIDFDGCNLISKDDYEKICTRSKVDYGDILMPMIGTVGKPVIVDTYKEFAIKNVALIKFYSDSQLNNKYVKEFLQSDYFNNMLLSKTRGGTQKFIALKDIRNLMISVPPSETQKQIVLNLDKINCLIDLCNNTLEKLDTLVKSRFVEMFGDCNTNSKGLETHKGKDVFKFSSGKFLPEEKRIESGIPVYGGNGIVWYTDYSLIDYPTIIIGRVGAQCGNIHMVNEPVWITDNAIYIKEQKKQFTLEFLSEMMKMMNFYQYADFSGQPKITQKPLESLDYLTPPIKLQMEFTDFVNQIIKEKTTVKKSLEKLETLKKSLMQEYFG